MPLGLSEALKDPDVIAALRRDPESFSFSEAPEAVVTMLSWPPHTIIEPEDYKLKDVVEGIPTIFPVHGPMIELLNILATYFNFTYKQAMPNDYSWGIIAPNGSWSGMMGQVFRREVDFGLGPFTIIDTRYKAVDMCYPFAFDALTLMLARGSAEIDPWGFLMPFTAVVWGVFFAMLGLICLVHFILEWNDDHKGSSRINQYGSVLFEYSQPPMDHALARKLWKSWQRPLIGSWILVSLLLNSSYGGILKSMYSLRFIPHPIQSVRDLMEYKSMKVIIEHRTAFLAAIGRFPSGPVKEMNDAGEAGRYVDLRMSDFMEYSDIVRRGDHAQIFDAITALQYSAKDFSATGKCDFYLAREPFMATMYAMISQKHSPLSPGVDAKIQRIFEAGLYKYWSIDNQDNITWCVNPPMKVLRNEAIKFTNIWGLAVIWGAGMLIGILAFILEQISTKL